LEVLLIKSECQNTRVKLKTINMKKTTLLFLAVCLLLFSFSCKKEKEKIDLYSTPTTNKLTCKINGKFWQATEVSAGFSLLPPDKYYFRLWALKENSSEFIEIYFNKPYSVLERKFDQNTLSWYYTSSPRDYGYFHRYNGFGNSEDYITNSTDTGYCTITYMDSVNLRIKGIFAFKARDTYTGKTIIVSDGYFEGVQ
jgi:hypothetical protein